jgi:hypothetical protein
VHHPRVATPRSKKQSRDPRTLAPKAQFNVRLDPALRAKLDKWLADLNHGRRLPLKRSDLVRGILDWAADNRPDWETK